MEFDCHGRRIVKEVKNSGDLNCTYHYDYNFHKVPFERGEKGCLNIE